MKISLAPMQGYSDLIYRSTLCHIGGVDVFYAPYIKVENDAIINKHLLDIDPATNAGMNVVPQVLANTSDDFMRVADAVEALGYTELNWNLGCPFPMVAKRKLGAGLLPYPETIDKVLSEVEKKSNITISVKMRLGYESPDEVWPVVDVLNRHRICEVILHPRIGKQMYNGKADTDIVPKVMARLRHPMAYNGDILSVDDAKRILEPNKGISHLMIGRGLLFNPFLAREIKGEIIDEATLRSQLMSLVGKVGEYQLGRLQGAGHFIVKMSTYWEYWSYMFAEQHKAYKAVKKSRTVDEYYDKVQDMILSWEMR